MAYDETSFVAGISVGRSLKGWSNKPGIYMLSNKRSGTLITAGSVKKDTSTTKTNGVLVTDGGILT